MVDALLLNYCIFAAKFNYCMKRKLFIVLLLIGCLNSISAQHGRFLDRVFSDIRMEEGIRYCSVAPINNDAPEDLYFDFYEPVGDTMQQRPLVITVFGGAFIAGGRNWVDMIAFADSLSHYGYVVASIDYRLMSWYSISETNFVRDAYAAAQDVSAAVRFFKANAETYRIDTNQIFVLGNSAGTIASMLTVWMDNHERPEETFEEEGFLGFGGHSDLGNIHSTGDEETLSYSPRIAGLIAQWGAVLDTNIIESGNQTPVCLIHGTADETVSFYAASPYEGKLGITSLILPKMYGSYYLDLRMNSMGIEHEFHVFEGEEHCFYLDGLSTLIPEKFDTCFRIAINFMARYNTYLQTPSIINESICTDINVFPNPAKDFLNIKAASNVGFYSYKLFDCTGRVMLSGENDSHISLSSLQSGVYILHVISGTQTFSRKIVIE